MKTIRMAVALAAALSLSILITPCTPAIAAQREAHRAEAQAEPSPVSIAEAARQVAESVSRFVAEDLVQGRISVQNFHHRGDQKKHALAAVIEGEISKALAARNEPILKLQAKAGAPLVLTGEYYLADDKSSLYLTAKLLSQSTVLWSSPKLRITQGDFSELSKPPVNSDLKPQH